MTPGLDLRGASGKAQSRIGSGVRLCAEKAAKIGRSGDRSTETRVVIAARASRSITRMVGIAARASRSIEQAKGLYVNPLIDRVGSDRRVDHSIARRRVAHRANRSTERVRGLQVASRRSEGL